MLRVIYMSPFINLHTKAFPSNWWHPRSSISRYFINFSLTGKTFSLQLIRRNCHKIADPLNRCSLFIEGQENLSDHVQHEKSNPKHCPYVYHLIQSEPDRMFPHRMSMGVATSFPIRIYKHKCGHYSTGQGIHRLCISGTLARPIPRVVLSYSRQQAWDIRCKANDYLFSSIRNAQLIQDQVQYDAPHVKSRRIMAMFIQCHCLL